MSERAPEFQTMHPVDDDRDQLRRELRLAQEPLENPSLLHKLLRTGDYNAISTTSNILSVISTKSVDRHENSHFKHVRVAGNRVCANVYRTDTNLRKVLHVLVAKQSQGGNDNQRPRSPSEQGYPEAKRFAHSATSLE